MRGRAVMKSVCSDDKDGASEGWFTGRSPWERSRPKLPERLGGETEPPSAPTASGPTDQQMNFVGLAGRRQSTRQPASISSSEVSNTSLDRARNSSSVPGRKYRLAKKTVAL